MAINIEYTLHETFTVYLYSYDQEVCCSYTDSGCIQDVVERVIDRLVKHNFNYANIKDIRSHSVATIKRT